MDNEFKNEVREQLNEFREKFAEIDNRFDKVENRLDRVENRLDKVENRLDKVENRLDNIESKLEDIESILLSLKRSMLIMEDYMKNNIPALFDGYSLNQDQHNEFKQKINNLEKDTDSNSLKISILEDTTKVHSSILESLQS